MRVPRTDSLGMLSSKMQNIPCCLHYLKTANPEYIEWFFHRWQGYLIVSVVEWVENKSFEWALHVDLGVLGKDGEVAILPFPWAEYHTPCVEEGLFAWRLFAKEEEKR